MNNPELSGGIVRLLFGALIAVILYLGMLFGRFSISDAEYGGLFLYFFSYTLLFLIIFYHWQGSFWLRITAIALDILTATISIALTGGPQSPFFLLYVWFWISTGTRFGKRYLLTTAVLEFVFYQALSLANGYWSEYAFVLVIQALLMILIPLYMSTLLGQLYDAKQAAEAASRAKSTFLANMSHDMRTPLVGIIGMNNLMRMTNMSAKQINYINTQERSAKILLALIDDILDVSKLEAQKAELLSEPFSLFKAVAEVYDLLAPLAQEKGLLFDSDMDDTLPGVVLGDELRFKQILNNLVGNAIKYTRAGEVRLRVRHCQGEDLDCLRFEVLDTGIGVTPDQQLVIFDSFRQGDSAFAKEYGGTGLGTTIAKRLVELMGGRIGVESRTGGGSCFWFEIVLPPTEAEPERDKPVAPQPTAPVGATEGYGKRLLLVEDNAINSYAHSSLLKELGFQVTVCADGLEALSYQGQGYDLVFMDMRMPNMDGPTATREWRRRERDGEHVPIIALTANSSPEDVQLCREAGMDDFVSKPVDLSQLRQLLVHYFDSIN